MPAIVGVQTVGSPDSELFHVTDWLDATVPVHPNTGTASDRTGEVAPCIVAPATGTWMLSFVIAVYGVYVVYCLQKYAVSPAPHPPPVPVLGCVQFVNDVETVPMIGRFVPPVQVKLATP